MRAMIRLLLLTAVPLLAAGCKSSSTVDNVAVSNDTVGNGMTGNTMAPTDDGMINYANPTATGNAGGTP